MYEWKEEIKNNKIREERKKAGRILQNIMTNILSWKEGRMEKDRKMVEKFEQAEEIRKGCKKTGDKEV